MVIVVAAAVSQASRMAAGWRGLGLVGVDIGVAIFPTHDAIGPAEVARLAEERGHESLFFPEHTRIPASRAVSLPRRR